MERRKYLQVMSRGLPPLLEQGVALVDIRRPEEWRQTGIVDGSLLLTFFDERGGSDPERWLTELAKWVPEERPLVLICRTGHRTVYVCEFLVEVTQRPLIYNVTDGIFGWLAEELPVVAPPSVPE